ncbi:MAG: MarR family winged helix-turn-helix transcriptional regulator [Planctomycetota bacterium]|jgi:DNA-binding MarR family transcriptional regulator
MKKMKDQHQGGFLMAKIRQVGGRIFERKLKKYKIDINPAQGRIMFALWQSDGVAISELAHRTQLKKSTLTSMLDRLEEAGYLVRVPSKKDRRKIAIRRTAKDRAMEAKYVEVSQEMTRLFYKGFSKSQIDRFETNLAKVLKNLTEFEAGNK